MREPKLNIYVCEFGCHNVTVDVDRGVTPFMIRCEFRGKPGRPLNLKYAENGRCIGTAQSCFYPRGTKPTHIGEPTHEWYRPEEAELAKLSEPEREHVAQGGLLLRPRTGKEPIYHEN